jgi:SAM-dependent methyltransferase
MTQLHEANADQAASWGGRSGQHWTERQEHMDRQLAPVGAAVFDAVEITTGMRAIDIGCGCGDTTLELARRIGPTGHALGLDISAPMLARARERTPKGAPVEFVQGDATIYAFPPGAADLLFSRFGVMFFADPALAFANIRKGLRKGGRVAFACWREAAINPSLTIAAQEVYKFVPRPAETPPPDAPGPFAFAQEARVRDILGKAGFAQIGVRAVDVDLDVAAGGGLDAAVENALEIGPASRAIDGQPPEIFERAAAAIRTAYAPYAKGNAVLIPAAIWIVTATNP